jgi:heme/copper-type cytochrome/quinol oxidase subunit 4
MKSNTDILKLPIVLIPLIVCVYIVIVYFLDLKNKKLSKKDLVKQGVVVSLLTSFVVFLHQDNSSKEEIFTNQAPF